MIDPFVIMAPVLLLAVIALLRFVGCAELAGIGPVQYAATALHIDTLNPPSATAGDTGITLTLTGTGFNSRSQVQWTTPSQTVSQPTTFDPTTNVLTLNIDNLIKPGTPGATVQVTVFNPKNPNDANSQDVTSDNAVTFTVNNPKPQITGFAPPDATFGDPDFELTVKGSNFVTGLTVTFGNTPVSVISVTPLLKVQIPANAPELASPNTNPGVTVTVTNPAPGGGSSSLPYTIQELVQVTFSPDPTPTPGTLPVPYENLNFETTKWAWEPGNLDDPANHIYFVSPQTSGSFTFATGHSPRLLKSMIASADYRGGTMTVGDTINPTQSLTFLPRTMGTPGTPQLLTLNWTMKSTTVTVTFTISDSLVIDSIKYQGPP